MSHSLLNVGGKSVTYSCLYCEKDITQLLRIKCAECKPDVYLCGDCFAAGVNIDDHKNYHSYYIVDCLEHPIFSKDWTISEELLLLEGIEKFGAGNWKIGSKNTRQCDEHYWEVYLGQFGKCLPAKTILNDSLHDTSSILAEAVLNGLSDEIGVPPGHSVGEVVTRDRSKESSRSKEKSDLRDRLSQLAGADLPGYMPLRRDFDVEYDNDAEVILAAMDMGSDEAHGGLPDHPSERALKLQVVSIYNRRLDERDRRKQFVIDHGLVDFRRQQLLERKRGKEERDLVARMKHLTRFQSADEHEALVQGLLKARRLRKQVQLYRSYRALGLRTVDEIRVHETERRKRESEAKARKQREREGATSLSLGISSFASGAAPGGTVGGKGLPGSRGRTSRGATGGGVGRTDDGDSWKTTDRGSRSAGDDGRSIGEAMSSAPGADLLSGRELKLCRDVDILPLHYLTAKETVVREAYRNGGLTLSGLKRVLRVSSATSLDPAAMRPAVADFFVRELSEAAGSVPVSAYMASLTNSLRAQSIKKTTAAGTEGPVSSAGVQSEVCTGGAGVLPKTVQDEVREGERGVDDGGEAGPEGDVGGLYSDDDEDDIPDVGFAGNSASMEFWDDILDVDSADEGGGGTESREEGGVKKQRVLE